MPGDGLCSFASVAVSLGRSAEEAVAVRSEIAAEVSARYKWYEKHIPELIIDYNINRILKVLQNPKASASQELWYPMPGGSTLIANTYNRPVIFYTPYEVAAMHTLPFFLPLPSEIQPIVIAHVNGVHYVPLELKITTSLPIPMLNPEWSLLHNQGAQGWQDYYATNVLVFIDLAKGLRQEQQKKADTGVESTVPTTLVIDASDDVSRSSSSDSSSSLSSSPSSPIW